MPASMSFHCCWENIIMFVMNQHRILFLRRLKDRGMKPYAFPGLYWSIKSCLHSNPEISDAEINRRLERLGWKGLNLDRDTLDLAKLCFDAEMN